MTRRLYIDAGIEHINFSLFDITGDDKREIPAGNIRIPNNDHVQNLFNLPAVSKLFTKIGNKNQTGCSSIYITGKLAQVIRNYLGTGEIVMPAATLWSAAKLLMRRNMTQGINSLGIIDLSASGYMMICVDKNEELKDDLLIVNPRCGAGTGVNLNRILEKLDIKRDAVDQILSEYLGDTGHEKRSQIPVRSDRCGVFSSSATISDKNQGIPLDYALAVTMKSEVNKPCERMLSQVDTIYLTGGVFQWQYARDCAEDVLKAKGIGNVYYDSKQLVSIDGLRYMVQNIGETKFIKHNRKRLRKPKTLISLPSFLTLQEKYKSAGLYERLDDPVLRDFPAERFTHTSLNMGLDIGSTMAKIVISDSVSGEILLKNSYNNHGDTIETVKHIFRILKQKGIEKLKIQNIGITGSGRYQVQKALKAIYPNLRDRISVMVENYAHVRGSVELARIQIKKLKKNGAKDINEDFCLLVDIGGEDTKISVIALSKNELFDNAMNVKCSAGTGSLMDTLSAMFDIKVIGDAYTNAFKSEKVYGINATCAVFLMENARKMQAEGYSKEEILASCCHAIVENMARSLWDQIDFPKNTLVLLHGQTMLSEPLPLAVTHRIQEYTRQNTYCLVPPFPGHRACLGLIEAMSKNDTEEIQTYIYLDKLLNLNFDRRVIICRGAVCGDTNSRCARTKLCSSETKNNISLTLGGCTAVNEYQARQNSNVTANVPDAYRDIWRFIDQELPKSQDENRLIIPRSFSISENAYFFARIFTNTGIPVHVDNVQRQDILEGQPLFSIDTCAPNIGATGQFLRLAREPHGIILVPQIEFLPIGGDSLGRTCTTNQGGVQIAQHFAESNYPHARFHLFDISLEKTDADFLSDQLYSKFSDVFSFYDLKISKNQFVDIIQDALIEQDKLRQATANLAADLIQTAIDRKLNISIISAREYILNPGIYDSHVGKLLKDKGVVAIPIYVFDAKPDKQFDYIYWKNPHILLTKVNAIVNKNFHKVIINKRLGRLIRSIEIGEADIMLSSVTVSTFRCGPDSITLPIQAEITKNHPTLLIQSDAIIAELAHLENRVNTHINQLKNSLHEELGKNGRQKFSIELLNDFNLNGQSKEECVIYFPTMGDNRTLSRVFRASGFTTIDNFEENAFDLEEKVKKGRKYLGDSVCVPLAAVFSDMIQAVDDFKRRKEINDPCVKDKEKIILFMQSGDGPCRQGQYIDICKLGIFKNFSETDNYFPVKFLANMSTALHNKKDYMGELENWASPQVYHVIIVKDVLHGIYLKFVSGCKNYSDFEKFTLEYQELKKQVYELIEHKMKPGKSARSIVNFIDEKIPGLSGVAKYFCYGLYNNNGLRRLFREFSQKWDKVGGNGKYKDNDKINIHVDGEIYLRLAQIEEILKLLIDFRGFDWFNLSYAPMWSYFEYIVEQRIVLAHDEIKKHEENLSSISSKKGEKEINYLIQEETKKIKEAESTSRIIKNILAQPLYKAAGLTMPHTVRDYISAARPVVPTLKPEGELIPYIGATITEINQGADLILNLAPEGCMVASMGEMLNSKIFQIVDNKSARIQHMSTTDGEINEDLLNLALLKIFGPHNYYTNHI